MWRFHPTNALTVNGGNLISENGFGNSWDGPITLNTDLTIQGFFTLIITGKISGTGGLIKANGGPLILTGANDYTGDTTVDGGTLEVNGTSIKDTNKLIINGGKVRAIGTEIVASLFFGAAPQASGTWGATGSGATNIDDIHFTGTAGVISVVPGGGSGYSAWQTANSTTQTIGQDLDNDGVANGIEYFINGPVANSSFTALPGVTNTGGGLSVTFTHAAGYTGAYGTDFRVETSATLAPGSWTAATPSGSPNVPDTVYTSGNDAIYTFPTGPVKKFARLVVTGP